MTEAEESTNFGKGRERVIVIVKSVAAKPCALNRFRSDARPNSS